MKLNNIGTQQMVYIFDFDKCKILILFLLSTMRAYTKVEGRWSRIRMSRVESKVEVKVEGLKLKCPYQK